ncbi:hypothetical protein Hanom_Chr16g01520671 [Helianthus anomalus]
MTLIHLDQLCPVIKEVGYVPLIEKLNIIQQNRKDHSSYRRPFVVQCTQQHQTYSLLCGKQHKQCYSTH